MDLRERRPDGRDVPAVSVEEEEPVKSVTAQRDDIAPSRITLMSVEGRRHIEPENPR